MYKLNSNKVLKTFSDEIIIFDIISSEKIYLNRTFSLILESIIKYDNYIDKILENIIYDNGEKQEIIDDINSSVKYLLDSGIIN